MLYYPRKSEANGGVQTNKRTEKKSTQTVLLLSCTRSTIMEQKRVVHEGNDRLGRSLNAMTWLLGLATERSFLLVVC
jgi:hypothetical protein